jgi:hypothetical protein
MWDPRRLTNLWASTAFYKNRFTFAFKRISCVLYLHCQSKSPQATTMSVQGAFHSHDLMYIFLILPNWTYGIQLWGTTSNSNIKILERFQSNVLRIIGDASWYVSNSVIRKDFQIPTVKEEISRFSSHYTVHISVHPTELIASLTEPPIHRHLRRYWPHDLLVRF